MRRYFFNLRVGAELAEDEEGLILPDLEAVQKEALRTLADIAQDLLSFPASMTVEVRDDAGSVMRASVIFEIDRTN